MTIRFTTLGCKLNFAESSAIAKSLLERGHVRAKAGEEADLCIINTCSVTDTADHKDRQAIHRIHRLNPHAIIVVCGCYAQLKPNEVADIPGVDYVLGQNEKFDIPSLINRLEQQQAIQVTPIRDSNRFHHAYSRDDRTRCFLKVQDGCNYFCSYCTIPMARGKSRNPKISELVTEAQTAIDQGAHEIILTGVNIGDFGRSTDERFIDLISTLDTLKGDYRIRISSCEPNLLNDDIIEFVAQSQHFAPHFHIPLQSGSNEVLRIMQRRYTRELFQERIEHIVRVMPNAFIGVDCMVGVRGETEEYFNDYVTFLQSLPVSQLHVFTYSERANTRMPEMDLLIVPQAERQRRSQVLHKLSDEKLQTYYANHRGQTATVLWEAKREGNQMSGFTENYIRVFCPYNGKKVNTFEKITL